MDKQEYAEYIKKITPKSKIWSSLLRAFIVGGLICLLGEGLGALLSRPPALSWAGEPMRRCII